jgi:hypothetical protein
VTKPGVLYVNCPGGKCSLVLRDPRVAKVAVGIGAADTALGPAGSTGEWTMQLEVGDVVVWPSWLEHYVDPSRRAEARVSISFNARVRRVQPGGLPRWRLQFVGSASPPGLKAPTRPTDEVFVVDDHDL